MAEESLKSTSNRQTDQLSNDDSLNVSHSNTGASLTSDTGEVRNQLLNQNDNIINENQLSENPELNIASEELNNVNSDIDIKSENQAKDSALTSSGCGIEQKQQEARINEDLDTGPLNDPGHSAVLDEEASVPVVGNNIASDTKQTLGENANTDSEGLLETAPVTVNPSQADSETSKPSERLESGPLDHNNSLDDKISTEETDVDTKAHGGRQTPEQEQTNTDSAKLKHTPELSSEKYENEDHGVPNSDSECLADSQAQAIAYSPKPVPETETHSDEKLLKENLTSDEQSDFINEISGVESNNIDKESTSQSGHIEEVLPTEDTDVEGTARIDKNQYQKNDNGPQCAESVNTKSDLRDDLKESRDPALAANDGNGAQNGSTDVGNIPLPEQSLTQPVSDKSDTNDEVSNVTEKPHTTIDKQGENNLKTENAIESVEIFKETKLDNSDISKENDESESLDGIQHDDSETHDSNETVEKVTGQEVDDNLTKVVISEEGIPTVSQTNIKKSITESELSESNFQAPSSSHEADLSGNPNGQEIPEEISEERSTDERNSVGEVEEDLIPSEDKPEDTVEETEDKEIEENIDEREETGSVHSEAYSEDNDHEDKSDMAEKTEETPLNETRENEDIQSAVVEKDKELPVSETKEIEEPKEAIKSENEQTVISDQTEQGQANTESIDHNSTNEDTSETKNANDLQTSESKDRPPEMKEESVTKDTSDGHVTNENLPVVEKPPSPEPTKQEPSPEPVKQLSPLEQLLERNVEIDGNIDSIPELETQVTSLLKSMTMVMKHYSDILKVQTLKDFTVDLGKFRGDFLSVNEALKKAGVMSSNINKHLKELRQDTEEVRSQITRKFQQEDLSTWIDQTPEKEKEKDRLQDVANAEEKAAMAKAAEARHAVAVATKGVAEAKQLAAEMETQAAEAEALSRRTEAQAEIAIAAAEEARIAAEERRKAEEAAKRRAEERARVKAEQDAQRKAQEEMKIHQEAARKGTDVADERRTFMQEKERKELERKNPKNWPIFSFDAKGFDFRPPIGVIIRSIEGSMRKSDVKCEVFDQSTGVLVLNEAEELVSNIVNIKQTDPEMKFSFDEPMSISFPVSFSRLPTGKETAVRCLTPQGKWLVLPTNDVYFDEYREVRFVECRCRELGTFAVVMRPKRDTLTFTRRGNKPTCSFDSRLFFLNRAGTFRSNVNATLEVNTLDMNAVTDIRTRAPQECEDLLTASPFVNFRLPPASHLLKPLTVTVPLPQVQRRPATAGVRETKAVDSRPATARASVTKEEESTDDVHVLTREENGAWSVLNDVMLVQPKSKDVVYFDITKPHDRLLLLRTKPGKKLRAVETMATLLEQASKRRNVKIILRQRQSNVLDVRVACTLSNKTDRTLKTLEEAGYTEGPAPSTDVQLHEGQQLYIKFRGNLTCTSKSPRLSFIFNSNIRTFRDFLVCELDVFAQKGLQCFRGFVQILTTALIPRPPTPGAPKNTPPEMVEAEILLAELLVELPKPEAGPPKPLDQAPLFLKEGPLTNGVLRLIAGQLGQEWRDLAAQLSLRPVRIQAILRQHVQILVNALEAVGRKDLAEDVRKKGIRYREERANGARTSHLKQAFVKVAKSHDVFQKWKQFANKLGVPKTDIEGIESRGGSGQEMCYSSLEKWSASAGDQATIATLARLLRSDRQDRLSRDVESISFMSAMNVS
ncbi:DTHD1-like protein [Mya arenaria]|uniref:DTHD1-like protein n=1 Tax=Mya arenaria TaxID=6604 RepID=A0ABY7EFA2_MYAAR|nr:DTHD1-like protein [Mya arenaria]